MRDTNGHQASDETIWDVLRSVTNARRTSDASVRDEAARKLDHVLRKRLRGVVRKIAGDDICTTFTIGNRRIMNLEGRQVQSDTLCPSPHIQIVRGLVSDDEASALITLATPRLKASTVHSYDRPPGVQDTRTSVSGHFRADENDLTMRIARRVAALCECRTSELEPLEVIRYEPGQSFLPHYDFLTTPTDDSPQYLKSIYSFGGQRLKTLIVYLSEPEPSETGGSTYFPKLHLRVSGRRGAGILWHNADASGMCNYNTLHGGEPTTHSTKFVMVTWVREHAVAAEAMAAEDLPSVRSYANA